LSDILPRSFYDRSPLKVGRELIGKRLVRAYLAGAELSGIIVETEAYGGKGDPASHAYRGKTPRNEVMFGEPGHAYIYFTYGFHYCLNFVTNPGEEGARAVLIRAAEPLTGLETMAIHRKTNVVTQLASGPGKLCQAFDIDKTLNGVDVTKKESAIRVEQASFSGQIEISRRIGIKTAMEKNWRFLMPSNPNVSKRPALKISRERET
jgi:DNA-3-methyladenine glycosylase